MVGHDQTIGAEPYRILGVLWVQNALEDDLTGPEITHPLNVVPTDRGIKIGPDPAHIVFQSNGLAQIGGDIAKVMGASQKPHIQRPLRLSHGLGHPAQRGHGAAHSGMGVAIARAGHGHVDRKDQGRDPLGQGPLQNALHEAAILEHIELEPDGLADRRADLFERADADR